MKIVKFTFNPIQENTYLAIDDERNAVIIDPGCYFEEERQLLRDYISKNELKVLALLNTHGHLDHIMGNAFVKREYGVDLYLHEADVVTLQMGGRSAQLYGLNLFEDSPMPDVFIKEGEILQFGKMSFHVIFGPRSEEHTSELQSRPHLVCRLLLEKK